METFKGVYKTDDRAVADLTPEEQSSVTEEYRIPTCSYRMGVPHMAYAAAVIGRFNVGVLQYWSLELYSFIGRSAEGIGFDVAQMHH